jgi:hypothetical protein
MTCAASGRDPQSVAWHVCVCASAREVPERRMSLIRVT